MIGDVITANLPHMRRQAESLMTAVGTLSHPDGEVRDPETGYVQPLWAVYYTGKLGVQRMARRADSQPLAGQDVLEIEATGKLPLVVTGIRPGDRLDVVHADDPELIETPLYVVSIAVGTHMVQRRITVTTSRTSA